MTDSHAIAKHLQETGGVVVSPADLRQQASSVRRAATTIEQQAKRLQGCLDREERAALERAAAILRTIGNAAEVGARKKKTAIVERENLRKAALIEVKKAFADVVDAGGVVALLGCSGSWRLELAEKKPLDAYAAEVIMRDERDEALDHFAWQLSKQGINFPDLAADLRRKFDQLRPALETKHGGLIAALRLIESDIDTR